MWIGLSAEPGELQASGVSLPAVGVVDSGRLVGLVVEGLAVERVAPLLVRAVGHADAADVLGSSIEIRMTPEEARELARELIDCAER